MWFKCVSILLFYSLSYVLAQQCQHHSFWSASANIPGTDKVRPVTEMVNEESFHIVDQHVPFLCTTRRVFRYLFDLRISNSDLQYIEPGAFQRMNLLYLSLTKNNLTVIEEGVFNDLPIKSLDLSDNKINHIKESAFDRMQNLKAVNLNGNALTSLNPNWFRFSVNIHKIYLKDNLIEEIPSYAFRYIQEDSFTSVVLTHNKISRIHSKAFGNFRRYGAFWLSNNLIQQIPEDMFISSEHNFELHLNSNQLSHISETTLETLSRSCKLINVRNNPLACSAIRNLRIHLHDIIEKDSDNQTTNIKFDDSGRCKHDMRFLMKYMHSSVPSL